MRIGPYLIHKKNSSALYEAVLRGSTLSTRRDRTIAEFATHWFEEVALRIRSSTALQIKARLNKHIIPKLGKIPLAELTRGEVARFSFDLLERGYTNLTVFHIVACLRQMYFDAMENGEVFYNPAANAERLLHRKRQSQEIRPFNRHDARRFLRFAKIYEPHYYPVFLCALTTGMRRGELLAIRPRDIDFTERLIHVRSSLAGNELTLPKGYKKRRVDMNARLATVLWKYLQWKRARALELEHEKPENQRHAKDELLAEIMAKPLFTGLYREKLSTYVVYRIFQRTLKRAGLRHIRLHDLRHTYATLLMQQGEDLTYIRDQLGHYSIQITVDTYGHLVAGSNRSAVERLAKSLENTKVHLNHNPHYKAKVATYMAKRSDHLRNWTLNE